MEKMRYARDASEMELFLHSMKYGRPKRYRFTGRDGGFWETQKEAEGTVELYRKAEQVFPDSDHTITFEVRDLDGFGWTPEAQDLADAVADSLDRCPGMG